MAVDPTNGIRANLDSLFIPVCYSPPYAFGYCLETIESENVLWIPGSPFDIPHVARFVFDTRCGDMVMVTCGGTPTAIGLHSMHSRVTRRPADTKSAPADGGQQSSPICDWDHEVLAVPAVPYEWPHLPSTVLWKISTQATRDVGEGDSALVSVPDSGVHTTPVAATPPITDLAPWPLTSNGVCHDGSTPNPYSNSADSIFSMKPLADVLDSISYHMSGRYQAPGFRVDILKQPSTVGSTQRIDTKQSELTIGRFNFMRPPPDRTMKMREQFATGYYFESLSPSPDVAFISPAPIYAEVNNIQKGSTGNSTSESKEFTAWLMATVGDSSNTDDADTVITPLLVSSNSTSDSSSKGSATMDDVLSDNVWNNPNTGVNSEICFVGNDVVNMDFDASPNAVVAPTIDDASSGLDTLGLDENVLDKILLSSSSPSSSDHHQSTHSDARASSNNAQHSSTLPQRSATTKRARTSSSMQDQDASEEPPAQTIQNEGGSGSVLAPQEVPIVSAEQGQSGLAKKADELLRKELLEARRRRNRISAARSNEKKRAMLAQLKKDMATQKQRAEELKALQALVMAENQKLKTQLQQRSIRYATSR